MKIVKEKTAKSLEAVTHTHTHIYLSLNKRKKNRYKKKMSYGKVGRLFGVHDTS